MTDHSINRDRWGRPLIIPPDGGKPKGYTRVSTLAKALDDGTGLTFWKQAMTAIGIGKDRTLQMRVASLLAKGGDTYKEQKGPLREICAQALTLAGSSKAAGAGTAIHEFTEVIDDGIRPEFVPPELLPILKAYDRETVGLKVVDKEVFVVVDELQAAGSLDRLYQFKMPDGRVVVGDIKTGASEPQYPLGVTTQCAIYAHGKRYNPATGERAPLHPDLDPTIGLLVHLPLEPDANGKHRCDVYELDLEHGWHAANLALDVRNTRKVAPLERLDFS